MDRLWRLRFPACAGGLCRVTLGASLAGQALSDGIEQLAQGNASSAHLLWMAHRYHRLRDGLRYGGLLERLLGLRHPPERCIWFVSFPPLPCLLFVLPPHVAGPAVS